jgi:lipopolysaccharide/colanic/teichoic acid biosynthesis glycosyltransferase
VTSDAPTPPPPVVSVPVAATYRGKRTFDLVVLLVAAVPALVLGAICAVAVKATSRGPVLFRQERVGRGGAPFTVYKFRSMVHGTTNPMIPDPDRITTVGRVLRRCSLDELPQLLNVIRADMSIVGPRPTLAYQVARYTPEQRRRLGVRPGLTGLAQVCGRNALDWDARIELDLEYVAHPSLRADASIVLRTVKVLVTGEGSGGHSSDDPIASP